MRQRIIIAIAGVAGLSIVLFALPLAAALQRSFTDEALLRLQRDTVAATRQIDLGTTRADQVELPPTTDAIAVYGLSGRRVLGRGPVVADRLTAQSLQTARATESHTNHTLLVAVPLVIGEKVSGAVRAQRSDAAVVRRVHRTWLAIAGLALMVVLAAAAAAVVLARRLARPLEDLEDAAGKLGEGDFSTRAPRSGVDEVDAVAVVLDQTADRLDDLLSRERAFSADASHQLRTPLAALRIELEAMQLEGESAPAVGAAIEQVDRLQTTIETLLEVARDIPRGNNTVDLCAQLDALDSRWHGVLAAAGRPLRVTVPASPQVAVASPRVVDEILDVLLQNAVEHGVGPVTASMRSLEHWIAIDIEDQGAGFEGDVESVFERRSERGAGHGIGLALAQSLAHAEGGRLAVTRATHPPVITLMLPAEPQSHGSDGQAAIVQR